MITTNRATDYFLGQTSVAVIGTTNQDGTSHLAPIWFTWKENRAYMFTSRSSIKWRNIQRKPKVTLCVDHRDPPYSYIILYGLITEIDIPLYQLVKPMAIRYYGLNKGKDFAKTFKNSSSFVAFTLNPYHIVEQLEL